MTTRGDIIVRASGGTDRLAIGTANQVLTSDGTDVGWADATGGGGVTVADILTAHRFPLAAHRGDIGSDDSYPEDSLEAITQAAVKGADIVEWDAAQSSDGTFWGSHDTTVDRTTNGTGTISALTDAYLGGSTTTRAMATTQGGTGRASP